MWPVVPLYGGGFLVAFAQLSLFYYSTAAVLHWVVPGVMHLRSIQAQPRKEGDVTRDAFGSVGPLMVKAAVWTLVELCFARGWGKLYAGPVTDMKQALYIVFTIVVLDYAHDAWFYWTHRLLHWAPLYRHIHYLHHRSHSPSAFTGYSFHLLEAALVFANEAIMVFLMPIHMGLHRWYHLFTTIIHEGGHAGYEITPLVPHLAGLFALATHGLCGSPAINTVQYHDLHHRFPRRHFSLYFTHWDRWCGTLHPTYDAEVFRYFDDGKKCDGRHPAGATVLGAAKQQAHAVAHT